MPYVKLDLPDGRSTIAHVRMSEPRRRRCVGCRQLIAHKHMRQCDARLKSKPGATCDAFVCTRCSTKPKQGIDLCPPHAEAWRAIMERKAMTQHESQWPHIHAADWRGFIILALLARDPMPVTAHWIGAAIRLNLTDVATSLRRLERAGLVRRESRPMRERNMGGAFLYSASMAAMRGASA